MVCLQVADIYLKMDEQSFDTELQNFENAYPETMTHELNQLRMQKSGQEMLQVIIKNDSGSTFTIVAERDDSTGDVTFKPCKIRSMNKSFYGTSYSDPDIIGSDEDPSIFFKAFMEQLCKSKNGTFAYMDATGHMGIIKDGKSEEVESIALANTNGVIYSVAGSKTVGDMDEDDGTKKFKIKKFWKEWLKENSDVAQGVNQIQDTSDKFNFMGKALIQKKLSGEIDFDEFQDVFIQICAYDVITDKTVLNFYQLLK